MSRRSELLFLVDDFIKKIKLKIQALDRDERIEVSRKIYDIICERLLSDLVYIFENGEKKYSWKTYSYIVKLFKKSPFIQHIHGNIYFIGKTGFLDHTFIQNKPNLYLFIHGKCLVSEPYHLTMKDVKELIKFCEENGLNFYIDGLSQHYPGHTLRIVIWKGERSA